MILTHPAKAETAYKRYVNRYIRNGGKVNVTLLRQIAVSTLIRIDKQSGALGVDVGTDVAQGVVDWVGEQTEYLRALRTEYKAANTEQRRNKVKFAARNQLGNLQSTLAARRMADIGINKFTWITRRDERVRQEHMRKHGKRYSIKSGAPSGDAFPGEGWACRCRMKPIANKSVKDKLKEASGLSRRGRLAVYGLVFGIAIGVGITKLADV